MFLSEEFLKFILQYPSIFTLLYPGYYFYNKATKVGDKPLGWAGLGILAGIIGYSLGLLVTLGLPQGWNGLEWALISWGLNNLVPLVGALLGCWLVDRALSRLARERGITEVVNEDDSWK